VPSRVKQARIYADDLGVHGLPGDVSPWRVEFDPENRAFLDREGDGAYRLRLWADPGLTDATVVERSARVTGHRLDRIGDDGLWEGLVPLSPGSGISLAFRNPEGIAVYRVPTGIAVAVERLDRWPVPDLAPIEVPPWARGALIYQIFPDRFANGEPDTDPSETDPWGSPPHPRRFQGGDLPGITQRLDYLAGLGVEVIYLNPIFASPSNHRYDALDYYEVDPVLGGNGALRKLVEEAHSRGMRVILDASFNHCHPGFFAFADLVRRGKRSPYRHWFVVNDWPVRIRLRKGRSGGWRESWEQLGLPVEEVSGPGPAVETTYESWFGVPSMPRINLAHPEPRRYFLEVAAHWIRDYQVDGWRMDVARYVDPDFWDDFRRAAKAEKPDAYLLCEVMGDSTPWLQGGQFDATMNYTFRALCLRFFARQNIDGVEFLSGLTRLYAQYAWSVALVNQNLIGSHDTPRFHTAAGGEPWRLRLATVCQLTFPGAPSIYYGDELGMEGGPEPGSRGAFPTEVDAVGTEPLATIRSLVALRRREPVLRQGDWRPLLGRGGLIAFERLDQRRRVVVAINRGRRSMSMGLPRRGRLLWGDGAVDQMQLVIPARQAAIVALGR
jgi:cyclomaltodextrinase / maltogenic alpha-amylase / neopullulanase